MFWASYGGGAYVLPKGSREPQRLQVAKTSDIKLLTSKSRPTKQIEDFVRELQPSEHRMMGGAWKIIEVARGTSTLYLHPQDKEIGVWDMCAPGLILREAGGMITDLSGMGVDYETGPLEHLRGLIVSNGTIHPSVIQRLRPYHSVKPYATESSTVAKHIQRS